MNVKNYEMSRIAKAITCALMPILLASTAMAEESLAKKAKKEKEELEVIEVTSYRDSIISSLNAKRNSDSVMDSISADDIGSFPDNNVAESLQRIPGISITRGLSGEGEGVSIRGFGPGKNVTLVNGQQLSSGSFNLENALGRGFNYGMLPSTIIKRVDVHKSTEAYLPEGGVGGTVNVTTRKPLNQKEELLFVTSGSANHNTISESTSPKLSALTSWKVNDKFGALVSFDYFDKNTRRDAVEIYNYKERSFVTADGTAYNNVIVPGAVGAANFNQSLKRTTAMVTLQYQPTDSIDTTFSYLRSDIDGDNLNTNLISLNHGGFFNHEIPDTVIDATYDEPSNTITNITYAAPSDSRPAQGRTAFSESVYRDSAVTSESFNYDIRWLGDYLMLTGAIGNSKSTGGPGLVTTASIRLSGASTVGIDDGIGYVKYHDVDPTNLSQAGVFGHGGRFIENINENSFASFDGDYAFDDSFITSVQFGARYTESSQEKNQLIYSNDFHKKTDERAPLRNLPAEFFGPLDTTPSDFLSNIGSSAVKSYQYLHPNYLFGRPDIEYTTRYHQGNTWAIEEEITSLYTQANFEYDFDSALLRGNLGLRYSDQKTEVTNFSNDLDWRVAEDLERINNKGFDVNNKGNSSKVLPSINLILDLQNDWVVRTAYSTVIARPAYSQLAQQLSVTRIQAEDEETGAEYTARRARRGNAGLEPFEADKYDLSTELYYAKGSSVSLAAFYYDVKTFVTTEDTEEDLFGDGDIYTVTQPVNRDGGSIKGIEAAVAHQFTSLPAPFNGLGVQLNYTYIDSDTKEVNTLNGEKLPLSGLSKSTYNAILFYNKAHWNARVSYNFRETFYEQPQFGYSRFNGDISRLTAKIKYKFDNGLSLYVQGTNLTNEQNTRYIGDKIRPFQTSEIGRNYALGFDYVF